MTHALSQTVVAKFGDTSVADFDAMNHSANVVLADKHVRLVVLSASAGVTNLLVALSEGLEATERFVKLDAIRKIQYDILERLAKPQVIREEIDRLDDSQIVAHLIDRRVVALIIANEEAVIFMCWKPVQQLSQCPWP